MTTSHSNQVVKPLTNEQRKYLIKQVEELTEQKITEQKSPIYLNDYILANEWLNANLAKARNGFELCLAKYPHNFSCYDVAKKIGFPLEKLRAKATEKEKKQLDANKAFREKVLALKQRTIDSLMLGESSAALKGLESFKAELAKCHP